MVLAAFHLGFQIKVLQYTATCFLLITTEKSEQLFFFSIQSNETGQHDRQDKRLTGQLPNQSGHCPSTSRYFEPCIIIDPCLMDYNIIVLALS